MVIAVAVKNSFFTYFSVDGETAKHREAIQDWNAEGISMRIQGPLPPAADPDAKNPYNGFGKRHLIVTEGGKHDGSATDKAKALANKRAENPAQKRQQAMTKWINAAIKPSDFDMKTETGRNAFKAAKEVKQSEIAPFYKTDPYGPKTVTTTVLILDGLTRADVASAFAKAINAKGPWASGNTKQVPFNLGAGTCFEVAKNGTTTPKNGMNVLVHFDGVLHHIYHFNGAF
ncbi:hypothetical protein [Elioraea sp.]|uniref:hypothetical protein n=1 Tax=Elioraea sp. TaxID=2185103 RepID=UPI0025BB0973|nr:hypothetical protein [Elioraea sp.]